MPSVIVATPQFATVPPLPGVPALNLDPNALFTLPSLVRADSSALGGFSTATRWGIFRTSGQAVLTAESVEAVEYQRDWRISNYPQQEGAFQSYNKVKTPFQAKVTFLVGSNRSNFLQAAEAAVALLDLVSIVTPEIQYPSANLTHLSYRRIATGGVTLIQVEIWCEEVRVVSQGQLSNGQSTNAASPQNNGTVQPKEASVQTSSATAADTKFVTPSGLVTGIPSPDGTIGGTGLGSTLSGEFGTKLVTGGFAEIPSGMPIATPDVASPIPDFSAAIP